MKTVMLLALTICLSLVIGGCDDRLPTTNIYYEQPFNFIEYQDATNNILDQGKIFAVFKIHEIENDLPSSTSFTFDPSKVEVLNLPPLPDGPNGQPLGSARQMPYATRPARSVTIPAGQKSGNTFIGNFIFRIQAQATPSDEFRLIYKDSTRNVAMIRRPAAPPGVIMRTQTPNDLALAGI